MISVSCLISLLSFCLDGLSTGESGTLKSSTILVWNLMCNLSCSNVSFRNEGALVFGAELFKIEISS